MGLSGVEFPAKCATRIQSRAQTQSDQDEWRVNSVTDCVRYEENQGSAGLASELRGEG
jgi:hypothetical protein